MYMVDYYFVMDLFVGVGVGQVVVGEGGLELFQVYVVVLGDGVYCLVQFFVGDMDVGVVVDLLLDVFDDQVFQYLLGQYVFGWQWCVVFEQCLVYFMQVLVELVLYDYIVVDDGDDLVQWYYFGMCEGVKECCV